MPTVRLSKSGKAVLFYPGDGKVYMTSKAWMEMLLKGDAQGNIIVISELGQATDNGVGELGYVNKDKKDKGDGFDFNKL